MKTKGDNLIRMTETKTTTRNHNDLSPSVYGGIIETEDFSTFSPNKRRINNQAEASDLPKILAAKKKKKDEEKKYMYMTFEELKEMKLISNTNGKPSSILTDERWQKEFNIRKLFVNPFDKSIKKLGVQHSKESGIWNEETQGAYCGATNWQEYCRYINDVLCNIRAGQVEYCYFIYQILDLLRFHFKDLRTRYCDGYWEVWLERR